jgi:hypothetical protein
MSAYTYLRDIAGKIIEYVGLVISSGSSDAGKLVALDDSGRLDMSVMPTGVGADIVSAAATEALADGDFVNLYDNSGTPSVRKADATTNGKPANGFVLSSFASGATVQVYKRGLNSHLTGLTCGQIMFLATTAGQATPTAPSGSANLVQEIGECTSATTIDFAPKKSVTKATT